MLLFDLGFHLALLVELFGRRQLRFLEPDLNLDARLLPRFGDGSFHDVGGFAPAAEEKGYCDEQNERRALCTGLGHEP